MLSRKNKRRGTRAHCRGMAETRSRRVASAARGINRRASRIYSFFASARIKENRQNCADRSSMSRVKPASPIYRDILPVFIMRKRGMKAAGGCDGKLNDKARRIFAPEILSNAINLARKYGQSCLECNEISKSCASPLIIYNGDKCIAVA